MTVNYKIGFIILHYISIDDTIKCVESIERLNDFENCIIYIVDNASPNKTGDILSEKYANSDHVAVVALENNLGFSEANNVAYRKMTSAYKLDFIIATNNDIVFEQIDFISNIYSIFRDNAFYVLGPDVRTKGDRHQNPKSAKPQSYFEAQNWLKYIEHQNAHINRFVIGKIISPYKRKLFKLLGLKKHVDSSNENRLKWDTPYQDVCLCGACLIFSSLFIKCYKDIFSPVTFFYHEEDILFTKLNINQHKSYYDPSIYVYHNNGVSTKHAFRKIKKRYQFQFKNNIDSCKIYLKFLEQNNLSQN